MRVTEKLKTSDLRKFHKNPWNTWDWLRVPSRPQKKQILKVALEKFLKSAVKHFIWKTILSNFVNLPTIFFPSLYVQNDKNKTKTSNNEHDWALVKYMNVLYHNRPQNHLLHFFLKYFLKIFFLKTSYFGYFGYVWPLPKTAMPTLTNFDVY